MFGNECLAGSEKSCFYDWIRLKKGLPMFYNVCYKNCSETDFV